MPWFVGGEISFHQIRAVVKILGWDGGAGSFPGLAGNQAGLVHELAHQLWARVDSPFGQGCVDASIPVGLVRLVEEMRNQNSEFFPAFLRLG